MLVELRNMSRTKIVRVLLLVVLSVNSALALRLVRLEMPGGVILGDPVRLNCSFDLENDQLYSVKWYKGNKEFFRFIPTERPPGQTYELPGVAVDVRSSNVNTLVLSKTDLQSEDLYKCEVSADAPSFQTIRSEKELNVYVLPKKGPEIVGVRSQYKIGDLVNVTCHAGPSKPAGRLEWFINGLHPSEDDDAAEVIYPTEEMQGLMSTALGLTFRAKKRHFDHMGSMKLKCTVTISQTYSLSSEKIVAGMDTKHYHTEALDDGPVIYGGQSHYHVGDTMNVTCMYTRYGKSVELQWLLNEQEVPPKFLVHYSQERLENRMYQTALGLRFIVRPTHFKHDQLNLKCIASVDGPERTHVVHQSPSGRSLGTHQGNSHPSPNLSAQSIYDSQYANDSRGLRVCAWLLLTILLALSLN